MAFETINPTTGERVARFDAHTDAQLDQILTQTRAAQREWAKVPFAERAKCMRRCGELLRERAREYAATMALEMGKPIKDGVAEVNKSAKACDHYAEHAEQQLQPRPEESDATRCYVRWDPLGTILAIMPWNFPYWQVFRFIAPNIMAGNAGLLKHAPCVPQVALSIEKVMRDAGFPEHLFRNLFIEPDAVERVIADDRVAGATLTGSERAGRAVGAAAGRAIKPVVLELGGSDPFIVLASADVDEAARVAVQSRTLNAGQSCIAAKRFIVDTRVADGFVDGVVKHMKALKMGDPLDPATDIGPQARFDLRDGLHQQVKAAVAEGAKPLLGCEIPAGKGAFYPPSVLGDVRADSVAGREEFFGPVASIIRVKDERDAVDVANCTKFGLGASLWTKDLALAEQLAPQIEAGAVFVNGMTKSDPRWPFGGIKASGVGRELGVEGLRAFTNAKTVWVR